MAKQQLTLHQHDAKMLDICGPSYGPVVALICRIAANNPDTYDQRSIKARMPDTRLALPTTPFDSTEQLKDGFFHAHGD